MDGSPCASAIKTVQGTTRHMIHESVKTTFGTFIHDRYNHRKTIGHRKLGFFGGINIGKP
jgi:hypothetical protein